MIFWLSPNFKHKQSFIRNLPKTSSTKLCVKKSATSFYSLLDTVECCERATDWKRSKRHVLVASISTDFVWFLERNRNSMSNRLLLFIWLFCRALIASTSVRSLLNLEQFSWNCSSSRQPEKQETISADMNAFNIALQHFPQKKCYEWGRKAFHKYSFVKVSLIRSLTSRSNVLIHITASFGKRIQCFSHSTCHVYRLVQIWHL